MHNACESKRLTQDFLKAKGRRVRRAHVSSLPRQFGGRSHNSDRFKRRAQFIRVSPPFVVYCLSRTVVVYCLRPDFMPCTTKRLCSLLSFSDGRSFCLRPDFIPCTTKRFRSLLSSSDDGLVQAHVVSEIVDSLNVQGPS